MGLGHDEAAGADARAAFGGDAAVDYHVLAYCVVVADVAECGLAVPAEVLGFGTYYRALEHAVVLAHACARHDRGVGEDFASVADFDVGVYKGERVYFYVFADLG